MAGLELTAEERILKKQELKENSGIATEKDECEAVCAVINAILRDADKSERQALISKNFSRSLYKSEQRAVSC